MAHELPAGLQRLAGDALVILADAGVDGEGGRGAEALEQLEEKRQTPTRMPYSCQDQFGTSGSSTWPVGAGSTWRAMGLPMSQTSRLTMVQTTMRASPGRRSGGRSTMAE
jgi:hypothetical protein